jgi:NTE family protein
MLLAVWRAGSDPPDGRSSGVSVMRYEADLVLEGGGVKGIALAGAITVLMDRGYEFKRVAGTSAGAIVGALVAAGVGKDELISTMSSLDYREFQDGHPWDHLAVGKMFDLIGEHGVYHGDYLKKWLGEQLARHGVHTFADLPYLDPGRPPADPARAFRSDIRHPEVVWPVIDASR